MKTEQQAVTPAPADMRPGLRETYEYWLRIKGDRELPVWADFDWMHLPSDVIPWCAVVDVKTDPLDFVYRFWGTARATLQNAEYTGTSIRDVKPKTVADKIWREYSHIAESAQPVHFTTTSAEEIDGETFSYSFIRLPFGADNRVDQILALGMYEETDIKKIQDFYGKLD